MVEGDKALQERKIFTEEFMAQVKQIMLGSSKSPKSDIAALQTEIISAPKVVPIGYYKCLPGTLHVTRGVMEKTL